MPKIIALWWGLGETFLEKKAEITSVFYARSMPKKEGVAISSKPTCSSSYMHRVCIMGRKKFWRNQLIFLRLLFHEIVLKCLSRQVYDVKKYHKKYYAQPSDKYLCLLDEKDMKKFKPHDGFFRAKSSVPGGPDWL